MFGGFQPTVFQPNFQIGIPVVVVVGTQAPQLVGHFVFGAMLGSFAQAQIIGQFTQSELIGRIQ